MQYLLRILTKTSYNFSRIYVDVVLNHMTENYEKAVSVCGATADTYKPYYPCVPYGPEHFNKPCDVNNYQVAANVSDTEL